MWRLLVKEMFHYRLTLVSALLAVTVAVASLVGATTLLKAHDLRTEQILQAKLEETQLEIVTLEDEVRKAMLELGYNLVILPAEQDRSTWFADSYSENNETMPEEYVYRMSEGGLTTLRHFLPVLQRRIHWPEQDRTIILIGTRGQVPNLNLQPRTPLTDAVPKDHIVLGYRLAEELDLEPGQNVTLLGHEFVVQETYPERGNEDDVTAWINLDQAQQMFDQEGRINAVLAVQCRCPGVDMPSVREEVTALLPDTQVVERHRLIRARADARQSAEQRGKATLALEKKAREDLRENREQFAGILVPVVLAGAGIWIALLGIANVNERRGELGILRALGLGSRKIAMLFLSKAAIVGLAGGILGYVLGIFAGSRLELLTVGEGGAEAIGALRLFSPLLLILSLVGAPVLAAAATWIPALMASQQDPAEILRQE